MKNKKAVKNIRGKLLTDPGKFRKKIEAAKILVFDWDGIFNDGTKGQIPSSFNEVDSMGINMLRFGYFLKNKKNPVTAIVTGERNETAIQWAEREHFHHVFLKAKNKVDVLDQLLQGNDLKKEEILFVFDDIHDLSLARVAGTRILVSNRGARLFAEYCKKMKYCDYITKNPGGGFALREISELVLDQLGLLKKTFESRINFDGQYAEYFQIRNQVKPVIQEMKNP